MRATMMAIVCAASGCGPTVLLPEDDPGSTGVTAPDPGTTLEMLPTTTDTPDETGTSEDGTGLPMPADSTGAITSAGFVDDPDGGGATTECSLWAQDCPAGEKCMPWANDGGNAWNATRCSPVVDDPGQGGDPCMVEGNGVSGIDTCDLGVMCWDVDPETNEGTCVDMCLGTESNPVCDDPDTYCVVDTGGAIILCLPRCDPVWQDCPEGQGCYPISGGFTCGPHYSAGVGQVGETCEFINVCEPGLFCANPAINTATCPDQGGLGCCNPFCNLDQPSCPNGEMCVPWFDDSNEFESVGNEHVGLCTTG